MYEVFHEHAHEKQHKTGSLVWLVWLVGQRIPGVRYFVTLWLEYDALRRARAEMLRAESKFKMRLWDDDAAHDARTKLGSYILRKELA